MFRVLTLLFVAAVGTTAAGSLVVRTQNPSTPGGQDPLQTREIPVEAETNTLLATWLLVDSELEMELARIAEERARDPEVKEFAKRMLEDHRQIAEKLQRFAAPVDIGSRALAGDPSPRTGEPREAGAPRPGVATGESGFDHVALVQELGAECLESARGELENKQGEEFDRCYMGMAIAQHMKADDTMTVFERHASGELRDVIQEGHQKVERHLERAKSWAEEKQREMGAK